LAALIKKVCDFRNSFNVCTPSYFPLYYGLVWKVQGLIHKEKQKELPRIRMEVKEFEAIKIISNYAFRIYKASIKVNKLSKP
jgi:hypothetical protein